MTYTMVEPFVASNNAEKEKIILQVVQRHSLYAAEELNISALLQEELGIDSIMLAAIGADLNRLFRPPYPVSIQGMETLRELIDNFAQYDLVDIAACEMLSDAILGDQEKPKPEDYAALAEPEYDDLTMRDFVSDTSNDIFAKVRRFTPFKEDRTKQGLFWYGMALRSRCTNRAIIFDENIGAEREFLMFASNDYLGLANDPRVIEAIIEATKTFGATNTGCRLIGGTNELHKTLEDKIAAFKQREACIVFPSGYSANVGVISAFLGPNDLAINDTYNHMSIQDGCKMSGAG